MDAGVEWEEGWVCREMLINIQSTKWSVMITLPQWRAKQAEATEGLASVASFVVPAFQINPVNNWMHFLRLEIE